MWKETSRYRQPGDSQARIMAKRQARQRVVQMILPEETDVPLAGVRLANRDAVSGSGWRPSGLILVNGKRLMPLLEHLEQRKTQVGFLCC
jgi:hypothetical protein